jgi:hypothetical protein
MGFRHKPIRDGSILRFDGGARSGYNTASPPEFPTRIRAKKAPDDPKSAGFCLALGVRRGW